MGSKKTIAIVDDHILIAQAIKGIIANFEDFETICECENGQELIDKINTYNVLPDIVLLDISMPVMDGFQTADWLQKNHPEVLVMVLSMQNDEQSVIKMVKNGAKSYLLKNSHPRELESALLKLVENGFYYPEWASKIIFSSINKTSNEALSKLTDREKEFLKYTITEKSYKEIAELMFCSPRTVESYRDNLFEKLNLKTRVGLAVYAIKNGYDQ
ncbi:MAG: DNA-binding response regulator [Flavobacterium sp.]|jgi:DNA-binding NarL/FixJ family response regulator|uniref:Response regulator transcription factor n=1 Tax=Flavobacterium cheonhonense TaxID=706185 RepID=A0ABP7TCK1_9FLAO|nr:MULTISPECIES: response regulator transcription factor [Flavobacterium]MBA4134207.1 DNA-binding response regulator [Flavobacterium sp.]PJE43954.1 MAG: DNA-binding response regulator [Flavobacterium sp.] [Flavobacterium sp. FEMGT703F]